MIERKPLFLFLGIAFAISWTLFCAPLLLINDSTASTTRQLIYTAFFALGMWGPGIAAIVTTLLVEKKPFSALRLNTLGPKRFYLWAWLLPPILTVATLAVTILSRTGEFDPNLTMMRDALAQVPAEAGLPPVEILVVFQIALALTLAPFMNVLFAMGEELGWRGYLLPKLLPLGQWRAMLLSGAVWGIWHAPAIMQGHNFPGHPYLGSLVMTVGCILAGVIFSWLYLNTRSPWVAALGHGALNASPGLALYFLKPGFDTLWGGLILGVSGWVATSVFIAWLIFTKRLPVPITEANE